jgi:hypothetical protein
MRGSVLRPAQLATRGAGDGVSGVSTYASLPEDRPPASQGVSAERDRGRAASAQGGHVAVGVERGAHPALSCLGSDEATAFAPRRQPTVSTSTTAMPWLAQHPGGLGSARVVPAAHAKNEGGNEGGAQGQNPSQTIPTHPKALAGPEVTERRAQRGIVAFGGVKKWWTGGELNSRHRDFQSRALACRGADLPIGTPHIPRLAARG